MLPKLAVFNGNVFIPVVSNTTVSVYEYCFNRSKNRSCNFMQKKCYEIEIPEGNLDIKWYGVVTTPNHITNMLTVFLLLQKQNGQLDIFCCVQKNFNCLLQRISSCNLPSDNRLSNFLISEGISILSLNKSMISIIHPLYKIEKTYDITSFIREQCTDLKVILFQCVNNYLKSNDFSTLYLFAIASIHASTGDKIISLFGWLWNSTNEIHNTLFILPVEKFFPAHFQKTLSALQIVFPNDVNFFHHADDNVTICSVPPWSRNKTIVCTNTELIVFTEGHLSYKCAIPLVNVDRIVIPKTTDFGTITNNIFLESCGIGVCLVTYTTQENDVQCIKTWMNAQHALPGDFHKVGSRQILIVFDDSYECWQVGCSVVHLNTFSESLNEEIYIPDEHLSTTVSALNKKVTAGSAAIVNAYYKIAEKTAEMASTFSRIAHQPEEANTYENRENDDLIDLILKKDKRNEMCQEVHAKTEPLALRVVASWKVFFSNQWIIGWTLMNVSKSTITNVNVTITSAGQKLEYLQKSFKQNISGADVHCVEPGKRTSVVSLIQTKISLIDVAELSCVISWSVGFHCRDNLLFGDEINLPCQQFPSQVTLNLQDMFHKSSLYELPDEQLLMSLRVPQEHVLLSIDSQGSDLSKFEETICNSTLSIRKVKDGEMEYLVFDDPTPLLGVNMAIKLMNKQSIGLEVHLKDTCEAVIFTQWLYSILPPDVAILPQETSDEKLMELRTKLLAAMKAEVELLRAFSENPSMNLDQEVEVLGDLDLKKITVSREKFLQMRQLLLKRELVTDYVLKELFEVLHIRN